MITHKDLIVSILCTFCLTATLLSIMPVKSAGEWDPWLDVKEDGTINVLDLIVTAGALGTSGNTAKNVSIAKHVNKLTYSIQNEAVVSGGYFFTPDISVDGYSKMTICLYSTTQVNKYFLYCQHSGGISFNVDIATDFGYSLVKTYDVPNQEIMILYYNLDTTPGTVSIDVYLIP